MVFAYNEFPAFAVAKDCWFRARSFKDAPFFLAVALLTQHLETFA
jgi:hypothetical protein